jgi:hypothetical protein
VSVSGQQRFTLLTPRLQIRCRAPRDGRGMRLRLKQRPLRLIRCGSCERPLGIPL